MAIYKVVLNGEYQNQRINNILWYRTGVGIDLDGLTVGGAKELAETVKAEVWPTMRPNLPLTYKLADVTVYPFHDGTFDLMFQNPYTLPVAETGLGNWATNGPAECCIIKFNLEPTTILPNGPKPPKRGYVAIGPIHEGAIDDSGHITDALFNDPGATLNTMAAKFASNLEHALPPVVWYPIRVHQERVLGLWKILSFADVQSAALRRLTSFRRSRQPEF